MFGGEINIRIRHYDSVVVCPAQRLNAFSMSNAGVLHDMGNWSGSHKRNRVNSGVFQNRGN